MRAQAGARAHRFIGGKRTSVAIGLCALTAVLVYLPTLSYPLVWDDVDIIVHNRSPLLSAFAHSFWHGGGAGILGQDPYYRPLTNFSLGLDELVAGHRAWYFHLVNALLHATVVALVGAVAGQVFGSFWPVLLAGMTYAVHPLAADSVAYVSGRTDLLAGIGLLVALLGLLRLRERHDWVAVVMTCAGFAFGLLSKESAAMFAIVAGVFLLGRGVRQMRRRDWIAVAGLLVLLGAYLAARGVVLGSVLGAPFRGHVGAFLLLSLDGFGRLLVKAVIPFWGEVFTQTSGRPTGYVALGVLYLALPLLFRPIRKHACAGLAWLWGAVMLLPFAGLAGFGPVGRLLYLPGIGLLLLALLLTRGLVRTPSRSRLAVGLALGYGLLLALLVLPRRVSVWRDGHTLFRLVTEQAPAYPAGHFNYAFELRARGDIAGAIAEYRKAIALDPSMALAYSNLGALLQSRGELDEAESLYRKTIELRPNYALAWNNLGIVRYKQGDGTGAVQAFRRAIALKPDDAGAIYNLGRVYQQAGMPDSAARLFERAYQLDPRHPQVRSSYEQMRNLPP